MPCSLPRPPLLQAFVPGLRFSGGTFLHPHRSSETPEITLVIFLRIVFRLSVAERINMSRFCSLSVSKCINRCPITIHPFVSFRIISSAYAPGKRRRETKKTAAGGSLHAATGFDATAFALCQTLYLLKAALAAGSNLASEP